MSKPRRLLWSEPPAVLRYAIAVLSVAIAIFVAELLTKWLHTEPIASAMLCAVIFAAWFGFGPGVAGDRTLPFGFPLLFAATNQFIWAEAQFTACGNYRGAALGPVFDYISFC
jgi:hypothetical protein